MYSIGKNIKDNEGNTWLITQMWESTDGDWLCLVLLGTFGTKMQGSIGGARFPIEDYEVTV